MTNAAPAKPAYFMVQVKAKSLEELSVRYAQAAIASLMKLGGQMRENGTEAGQLSCVFQAWKWRKLGITPLSTSH